MKDIDNIYVLKDLSRFSGQSIHTIKFYLNMGLIREIGRSPQTRIRYFNDQTLMRLSQIRLWRKERKSLEVIRRMLPASNFQLPTSVRA